MVLDSGGNGYRKKEVEAISTKAEKQKEQVWVTCENVLEDKLNSQQNE